MSLDFPLGLLGLVSLPLIVVLHLLQQRNRTILISHIALWNFLEKQVQGARFRRVPLNILLILDLLVATLLSLALAQPRLNLPISFVRNIHRIVILDISTSMKAQDIPPSRFERSRLDILAQAEESNFGDIFTLITAGESARILGDTRFQSMEEILRTIQTLEAGDGGTSIQEAMLLAEAIGEPSLPKEVHIYTDGAWSSTALQVPENLHLVWHWKGEPIGNQAVLDVSASETTDQKWEVSALLANFADQTVRRIVSLKAEDDVIESIPLELPPKAVYPIRWQLRNAPKYVSVVLATGDPLPEDDFASTGVTVLQNIRVALVSKQPDPILKALKAFRMVSVSSYTSVDELPHQHFDLVIYHQVLPADYPYQAILLLDPPLSEWLSWDETLVSNQWIPTIENEVTEGLDSSGLREVVLPKLKEIPLDFQMLLQTATDPPAPVLLRGLRDQSDVILFLPRISSGNLLRHPFWVGFLGNVISNTTSPSIPSKIKIGTPLPIPPSALYPTMRLITPKGETISFGEQRTTEWTKTQQSGVYRYQLINRFGIEDEITVGVNAGDWQESNLLNSQKNVENVTAPIFPSSLSSSPISLTPLILGLACIILLIEARYAWR